MNGRWRSKAWFVVGIALCAILGLRYWPARAAVASPTQSAPQPTRVAATRLVQQGTSGAVPKAAPEPAPQRAFDPEEEARRFPAQLQVQPDARKYLKKYNGMTVPMSPWLTFQAPFPTIKLSSVEAHPTLTVWLPATRVKFGEVTRLYAELRGDVADAVRPRTLKAVFRPRGRPDREFELPFQATHEGASDLYFVELPIEPSRFARERRDPLAAPVAAEYSVTASGSYHDIEFIRSVVGSFFIHEPGAEIVANSATVKRREHEAGTDLVLTVQIQVTRPGSYWTGAELWAGDKPVAQAQLRLGTLEPGTYPISLLFGGEVLRDSHRDGPYTVRNVRLRQIDSVPPQEADPVAALPATPSYRADQFE